MCDRPAARNLTVLRKAALNLLTGDRSGQTSLRGRRKKATWNDDYMLRIIANQTQCMNPARGGDVSECEIWRRSLDRNVTC